MRQIIAILLSLSLSWVTTSYACEAGMTQMTQHCCQPSQVNHCPATGSSHHDMAKPDGTCCQTVACVAAQGDAVPVTVSGFLEQFQPLAPPPSLGIKAISLNLYQSASLVTWVDDQLPSWGTQTYLQTARLRI